MRGDIRSIWFGTRVVFHALLRDRSNLFQSLLQPTLLATILSLTLADAFQAMPTASLVPLRSTYLSASASSFYGAMLMTMTILFSSQYGTYCEESLLKRLSSRGVSHRASFRFAVSALLGHTLFVFTAIVMFAAFTGAILGSDWPWLDAGFWASVLMLVALSVLTGQILVLLIRNREVADLLISTLVFGSAAVAGGFFPYPESARAWAVAPYTPFARLLSQTLRHMAGVERIGPNHLLRLFAVLLVALGIYALGMVWRERRPATRHLSGSGVRRVRLDGVCGVALILLPSLLWFFGPTDTALVNGISFLFPYGGIATVLMLLLGAALAARTVKRSHIVLASGRVYRTHWLHSAGWMAIVLLLSTFAVWIHWRLTFQVLALSALLLFTIGTWSLALCTQIARWSKDSLVYWVIAGALVAAVALLGASLWSLNTLEPVARSLALALPNGLLLNRPTMRSFVIIWVQVVALLLLPSPGLRRARTRIRIGDRGTTEGNRTEGSEQQPDEQTTVEYSDVRNALVLHERARVLRTIHDTLGHSITGALWQIRSAKGLVADTAARAILERAEHGLEQGLSSIREYLRDSEPRRRGGWADVHRMINEYAECPIDLNVEGRTHAFEPAAVNAFCQTIGELLTNASRYGDPVSINIRLCEGTTHYTLCYTEQGNGWGSSGPKLGFGLSGIQRLYEEMGGEILFGTPQSTSGVEVVGRIPKEETGNRSFGAREHK